MPFAHRAERTTDSLLEGPQAILAGERNVRLSRGIVPVSLNPEGGLAGLPVGRRSLRLGEPPDDPQQGPDTTALLVEGIGGNSRGTSSPENAPFIAISGIEGKRWWTTELEAGHIRHVEIGENDIGDLLPNFSQCGESVFCRPN